MKQKRFNSFRDALNVVPSGRDQHILRNFNFMNDGQPPSARAMVEALGFIVEEEAMPRGTSGYLTPEPFAEKGFKIVVNRSHRVTRRRFTVLHEVAHYYLHPRYTEVLAPDAHRADLSGIDHFYASPEELIEEREANEWAEAIIFEQQALRAQMTLLNGDKIEVARRFGVSAETLNIVLRKRGFK